MANNKNLKIKNGLQAGRYLGSNGTEIAGANGPYGTFSTTLYTGNGSTQTITNGIDLAGEGGLVWSKGRSQASWHNFFDTERGASKQLEINTDAELTNSAGINSFNSGGYTMGSWGGVNNSGVDYVSWTFRKAPKFFDVVTYTGTSNSQTDFQDISHNLGAIPGMVIVKRLNSSENWAVWHRSIDSSGDMLQLNIADSKTGSGGRFSANNVSNMTATTFRVYGDNQTGASGATYVAYLFAHNDGDGGFGPDGDADIIKCGSYTGNNTTGNSVDLGFEPQWLLIKNATYGAGNDQGWWMVDTMRGITTGGIEETLQANTNSAADNYSRIDVTATGFSLTSGGEFNRNSDTFIYMAIRAEVQTQTLDLSTGHTFSITPTEALDILFSNPPASGTATGFSVEVDNTGGYAITWPSSVKWHLGTAPTVTETKELYTFITTDGGTTYYGKKSAEIL